MEFPVTKVTLSCWVPSSDGGVVVASDDGDDDENATTTQGQPDIQERSTSMRGIIGLLYF